MTAGQDALTSAAAAEAALVYTRCVPEWHPELPDLSDLEEAAERAAQRFAIEAAVKRGLTNSQIMSTLHVSYEDVRAVRIRGAA